LRDDILPPTDNLLIFALAGGFFSADYSPNISFQGQSELKKSSVKNNTIPQALK